MRGYEESQIIILDAMPAMADVVSGVVPRPEAFVPSPEGTPWRELHYWWHWATKSHAGRRAFSEINCPVDPEEPWSLGDPTRHGHWRVQPWCDPGKSPLGHSPIPELREALGEPDAGVFYVEYVNCNAGGGHTYSQRHFVAVNEDGTRAAIMLLAPAPINCKRQEEL